MEYAIELLIPVLMGLYGGMWMTEHWNVSPLVTPVLAIVGMVMGIAIMARRVKRMQAKLPKPDSSKMTPIPNDEPIADSPWNTWDDNDDPEWNDSPKP